MNDRITDLPLLPVNLSRALFDSGRIVGSALVSLASGGTRDEEVGYV